MYAGAQLIGDPLEAWSGLESGSRSQVVKVVGVFFCLPLFLDPIQKKVNHG